MRRRLADPHKLRSRPKWSSDEEVELWAELDKLLLHQIGKLSPTIIWEKLKVALRKRKPKQIEGKLYAMWRKHTGSDSRELFLQDVCTIGSKSLTKLDESTRLKIQAKLEAMHEAELYSPRKTRSISANSRVEPILFLRDQTIASGHGRSGKRASTEQVETPTRHTSDSNKQPMIKTDPTYEVVPAQHKHHSRLCNLRSDTSVADTEDCIDVRQSFETCSEGIPIEDPENASQAFFYANEPRNPSSIEYDNPAPLEQFLEEPILDHTYETLRDLLSDNAYFRKELATLKKQRQIVDKVERYIEGVYHAANGKLDVETAIERLKKQQTLIIQLQSEQKNNNLFLQKYLHLKREDHVTISFEKIKSNLGLMQRELDSLSIMDEFQYPREYPQSSASTAELLSTVMGTVELLSVHDHDTNSSEDRVPIHSVIQYITGTAICEWVFHAELRCTAMMSVPLLDKYRHHLGTYCGEVALRNIDFAAHQSVIDGGDDDGDGGGYFQKIFLPRAATKLADRLLDVLQSFIKHDKHRPRHRRTRRIKPHFESIFQYALAAKSQAMIGKDIFETIWPDHGSAFDSKCMRVKAMKRDRCGRDNSESLPVIVKLPLVPGIRVYRYDRKLVDYCSFTNGSEKDLGNPDTLWEALVTVER